ncbi:MFS transporter [Rhizobium rhizogenes]|uniref:MFS transporter n=1 Tax=Rhizobium rhizogenes TaxID=359 RepID=UPI00286866CA|nr:MFS transporter [Rhizobium rhizogenes]
MNQLRTPQMTRTQTGITVTLSLAMGLASLGTSIANIALPELGKAFSAPVPEVQAVIVAYLGTLTLAVVIAGRLADRYGLRAMLVIGIALFIIATFLCAVAQSLWILVVARGIQGIGAAFLMTLSMALMRHISDKLSVGRAMGLLGTVSAIGTALGPALGGLLIPFTGWRGVFWVQLPLSILALILAVTNLPRDAGRNDAKTPSLWSVMSRSLLVNLSVNVVVAGTMMTTLVVGPFYLSIALELPVSQVGLVMAIGPVISIFSGVPAGRLVDAVGSNRMLSIGLALLAIGTLMLAYIPNMIGVAGYVLSIIMLTPGYQLFQAANNTAALADVATDRRGTVSGLLGLSRNIGLIAGASVLGMVFAFGVGSTDVTQASAFAIASGMRLTFLIAFTATMIALVMMFRLPDWLKSSRR